MGDIANLVPRVRETLKVDSSYDAEIIPFGIQRAMTRLLRDYHFPWSVRTVPFTGLTANQTQYTLPSDFKKDLMVQFYDTAALAYSDPLDKVSGFRRANSDGVPRFFWLAGNKLNTDIKLPAAEIATTQLLLTYESLSWSINESWMIDQFEDMIYTLSVFRLATELNKEELAKLFATLWGDDRQALAIYTNELEFDNGVYTQRESKPPRGERYPRS